MCLRLVLNLEVVGCDLTHYICVINKIGWTSSHLQPISISAWLVGKKRDVGGRFYDNHVCLFDESIVQYLLQWHIINGLMISSQFKTVDKI